MARRDGLVIQETPDELLVYDLETNKAHCLNQTALNVWKACDGKNNITDLARLYGSGNEDLIWLAIDQLKENDLLEKESVLDFNGRTRRDLIKKIGFASVIALPVVASLTAPSSVLAVGSCACTAPADCAPGTANANAGCPTASCGATACSATAAPVTAPSDQGLKGSDQGLKVR